LKWNIDDNYSGGLDARTMASGGLLNRRERNVRNGMSRLDLCDRSPATTGNVAVKSLPQMKPITLIYTDAWSAY